MQRNPLTLPVIAASFMLVGVMTTFSGVLLPFLATRYALPAATTAWLFPAQFFSAATGVVSAGVLLRRYGFRAALGMGYAMLTVGTALFLPATWPSMLAGVCFYGMGIGILNPASNLAAGTLSRRGPVMVNALNFCWGTGAVAGPMILPTLLSHSGAGVVAWVLAPLTAAAFAGVVTVAPTGAANSRKSESSEGLANALLSGAVLLLYVGTETTIAGWMPLYGARALGANTFEVGLTLSIVWGAVMVGRAAGPFVVGRAGVDRMIRASLVLLAAGIGVIVCIHTLPALMLGCMMSGLGLATVFPNIVAAYTGSGGRNVSVVFLMASCGGATLPWIAGRLVNSTGQPLMAIAPAAAATVLIAVVWAVLRRRLGLAAHE